MQMTMFQEPTKTQSVPPRQLPGCSLIYQPKGRAREYAALACNVYSGCDHGCVYCYAPSATRRSPSQFYESSTRAGQFLRKLEREAVKYQDAGIQARVLLSFTCDPYQHLDVEEQVTRQAIQILHHHGLAVEVLTKGGYRALRDLELFTDRDAFATTMTLLHSHQSEEWEPNAASPQSRMDAIRTFHKAGIPTWVSLEPVIFPEQSLEIIRRIHDSVDVFKVGTLNYHPRAKAIDWPLFADNAVRLLTSLGYHRNTDPDTLQAGDFYIKRDLAASLSR